jgi:hypothetical protein
MGPGGISQADIKDLRSLKEQLSAEELITLPLPRADTTASGPRHAEATPSTSGAELTAATASTTLPGQTPEKAAARASVTPQRRMTTGRIIDGKPQPVTEPTGTGPLTPSYIHLAVGCLRGPVMGEM